MPIPQKVLRQLYLTEQKSMCDVANILNCSVHKVEYWLEKYQISRRSRSDANYVKYNPKGEPFHIKNKLSIKEQNLHYLALGLYWGEGGKTGNHSTRLVNSDPALINIFYQFLTIICQIKPSKIHFHLQTFKDNNTEVALNYWSKKINISQSLITTCKPIPSQGKGNYKRICTNGVMTVGVYNTHFHTWIMEQLRKLGYNPDYHC